MRECYDQAQEMLSLKKAYDEAVKRSRYNSPSLLTIGVFRELESMQQHLKGLKVKAEGDEDERKADE